MNPVEVPFAFGRVVDGPHFINRTNEIQKLTQNLKTGLNTILISPRRWGKSSLVGQAINQLRKEKHIKVCVLDLFNIRTEKDFYERYAQTVLKSTSSKWEDWIDGGKKFFKRLVPQFTLGTDPLHDFSVSFSIAQLNKDKDEILQFPEAIAKEKKLKLIICIDEFQNISNYEDPLALQKQLRSVWQHHQHVTYCLYGSKRHMITEMFENKSMPFYKFGETVLLQKISTDHWIEYIISSFKLTGKNISTELAEKICSISQNHPYFTQQLARKVWVLSEKETHSETLEKSLQELLDENSILYLREVENLSNTQLNFLHAICDRIKQLSASETLKKYQLGTSANVLRIKQALEQKEIIDFMSPYPEFIDPIFEFWLMKRFF